MEVVAVTPDPTFWKDRRVFLSGHTGFKGGWLALWLQSLGARVMGFALPPDGPPSLFDAARVAEGMESQVGDIRDLPALTAAVTGFKPEILIHMAAQPLVRESYRDPVTTYASNVMGTVHCLEAARAAPSVRAIVVVTTDKCYENREWVWGYREDEAMGGHDPYSSSKGCAELVCSAYRRSFFTPDGPGLATARAGNVIGGGDWAADRLIPDILHAFERGVPVRVRNPLSIRPWQHVLEPLSGYLKLAEALCGDHPERFAQGWNFGPREEDARPVQWIVEYMAERWGGGAGWERDADFHPHEARYLKLDTAKARDALDWRPRLRLDDALDRIVTWRQAWRRNDDMHALTLREIVDYANDAAAARDLSGATAGQPTL